jgi:hypothetical protein
MAYKIYIFITRESWREFIYIRERYLWHTRKKDDMSSKSGAWLLLSSLYLCYWLHNKADLFLNGIREEKHDKAWTAEKFVKVLIKFQGCNKRLYNSPGVKMDVTYAHNSNCKIILQLKLQTFRSFIHKW